MNDEPKCPSCDKPMHKLKEAGAYECQNANCDVIKVKGAFYGSSNFVARKIVRASVM